MNIKSKLQEIMMRRSDESSDSESSWDAGLVCENLYVGSLRAALDLQSLRSYNIGAILTVAGRLKTNVPSEIRHLIIDIADHPSADIIGILPIAFQFLDEQLRSGKVLVHCASGISRSVSVCCAWLMTRKAMSFDSACRTVRINRPRAAPNVGFYAQLSVLSSFLQSHDLANGAIDLEQVRERYHALLGGDGITNIIFAQRTRANELHALTDSVEEAMKHCFQLTDFNASTMQQWRSDLVTVIQEVMLLQPGAIDTLPISTTLTSSSIVFCSDSSGTTLCEKRNVIESFAVDNQGDLNKDIHLHRHQTLATSLNIQDNPSRMIRDAALRKAQRLLEELDVLSCQIVL